MKKITKLGLLLLASFTLVTGCGEKDKEDKDTSKDETNNTETNDTYVENTKSTDKLYFAMTDKITDLTGIYYSTKNLQYNYNYLESDINKALATIEIMRNESSANFLDGIGYTYVLESSFKSEFKKIFNKEFDTNLLSSEVKSQTIKKLTGSELKQLTQNSSLNVNESANYYVTVDPTMPLDAMQFERETLEKNGDIYSLKFKVLKDSSDKKVIDYKKSDGYYNEYPTELEYAYLTITYKIVDGTYLYESITFSKLN